MPVENDDLTEYIISPSKLIEGRMCLANTFSSPIRLSFVFSDS